MRNFPRIRNLREDKDLSQAEMAKVLNTSRRTYTHYEDGDRDIPIDILIQMADFHETSIDYILERTNKKKLQ